MKNKLKGKYFDRIIYLDMNSNREEDDPIKTRSQGKWIFLVVLVQTSGAYHSSIYYFYQKEWYLTYQNYHLC